MSIGEEPDEGGAADKAEELMGWKTPVISWPIQMTSIPGTWGGNKPWYARV